MPLKLVRREGYANWYVRGTHRGTEIFRSTGTDQKADAEAIRVKVEAELEERHIYGPEAVTTFTQAADMYLDAGGQAKYLAKPVKFFQGKKLHEIGQLEIDAGARWAYPDAKPSTVNRHWYTPVSAVLTHAADLGLCEHRRIRRPKGHDKWTKFRWLWPEEVQRVWDIAPPHVRVILDLYCGTGIRESEGITLDWDSVWLQLGQAQLDDTKNGESRIITLPARTVAALGNLEHRTYRVLQNGTGGYWDDDREGGGVLRTALAYWSKKAGVRPFSAHVMRHTWATWHYSANKDVIALRELGGWKSEQVYRYVKMAPNGLGDELLKFGWDFGQAQEASANVRSM